MKSSVQESVYPNWSTLLERRARLASGLILFAYATCHFLSHATGVFGLAVLDAVGRRVILAPWQNIVGHTTIFASLFVHGSLGLRALYRRRHLRIPVAEAAQLWIGLSIPLLLIPHVVDVRLGHAAFGLADTYYRILFYYWLSAPAIGLSRQFLLLFFVWCHGCIGLHFLMRYHTWYRRRREALLALAILVPFTAVLGLINAGWDTAMKSVLEPGFVDRNGPHAAAQAGPMLEWIWQTFQLVYVGLIVLVLIARLAREAVSRHLRIRLTYPGNRIVSVMRGFSVLEASRWAGIPHASICGGRARCSTCRVRVSHPIAGLPLASAMERATLDAIRAPSNVRLACQLRPAGDLTLDPLLPADVKPFEITVAGEFGRETKLTALHVDLRDSTRLAANRLPFDALFVADRYVRRMTATIHAHKGRVTSIAGDGIMSIFGADTPDGGARSALEAAVAMCADLEALSDELRGDLDHPLGFGIGLHTDVVAAGTVFDIGRPSLLYLGHVGNVAARLEGLTKVFGCRVILSAAAMKEAGVDVPASLRQERVRLAGLDDPIDVFLLDEFAINAITWT